MMMMMLFQFQFAWHGISGYDVDTGQIRRVLHCAVRGLDQGRRFRLNRFDESDSLHGDLFEGLPIILDEVRRERRRSHCSGGCQFQNRSIAREISSSV